jgi:tetratricopeptide (TPR) repeat protein
MKRTACALIVLLASGIALGQSTHELRMNAIWGAVRERVDRQNDKWFDDGDYPRCIQALLIAQPLFPSDYEIATSLGWLLESIQVPDQALAVYSRYRKDNPNDADAAEPEATFYFKRKAYAKVPPLLEPTLNAAKRPHPNSFRILAHAYERLGQLRDSKRIWELYLESAPNDEAAKRNLSRVVGKIERGSTS